MKTLLNKTSTLVAASIAMGSLAYTSSAFAQYGPVSLGGEISLGFQQYDTTVPAGHIYEPISRSDVVAQTGGFELEIDIDVPLPEYGVTAFGYADLAASSTFVDLSGVAIALESMALGVSTRQGALMVRTGARDTDYAYAGDISVGGSGVSTKFLDEAFGNESLFNAPEIIYAYAEGPFSASVAWEPESEKISGAAGYDFRTVYGPGRINGYVFEDQVAKDNSIIHLIEGYRVGAFLDNGAVEVGANISVEDVELVGGGDIDRQSLGLSAKVQVDPSLAVSFDFETGEITGFGPTTDEYQHFSIGAELLIGETLKVGGYFKQYDGAIMPLPGVFNDPTSALNGPIFEYMEGQEFGGTVSLLF